MHATTALWHGNLHHPQGDFRCRVAIGVLTKASLIAALDRSTPCAR